MRLCVTAALLLAGRAAALWANAKAWEGLYSDPDGLAITLQVVEASSTLTASSADWTISGTLTGPDSASLAGLDGQLRPDGIQWSNGT